MSQSNSRIVLPELLDQLPPDDPQACRSRRDLQRIHVAMRTRSTLHKAIADLQLSSTPRRILELGAGDGSLLLALIRKMADRWPAGLVTLLDRQDVVSRDTRQCFRDLGWQVTVLQQDVLDWARGPDPARHDLCLTTLFLHHFRDHELAAILSAVMARSDAFVACEPRRDLRTRVGSRLIGLLGGNQVTRADAITSVAAGFTGTELSQAWPDHSGAWIIRESRAFPFTHLFSAQASPTRFSGEDA